MVRLPPLLLVIVPVLLWASGPLLLESRSALRDTGCTSVVVPEVTASWLVGLSCTVLSAASFSVERVRLMHWSRGLLEHVESYD